MYVIRVEQLERQVLADRQGLIARGAAYEDLPSIDDEQERFDAMLAAEPQRRAEMSVADLEKFEELTALGVA